MEIGAVIVDDELKNQVLLEKMLDKCHYKIQVLGKAFNVTEAKAVIEEHKPRVVFLDVEMPGGNGFSLLESIPNPNFDVIFTTAHDSYALKAFKYAAVDYLLKPINYKELLDSLKRLITKYESEAETNGDQQAGYEVLKNSFTDDFSFTKLALPSADGLDFVELDNILRCEADRSYCNFYLTDNTKVLVSKSLKEFEDLLEEAGFFRVHKSNMVNLKHIKKYVRGTGGYVVMKDDSQVTVSARRKDLLLTVLSKRR